MTTDAVVQRSKAWEAGYEAGQRSGSNRPPAKRSDAWKSEFADGYAAGKAQARAIYDDFMRVHMERKE